MRRPGDREAATHVASEGRPRPVRRFLVALGLILGGYLLALVVADSIAASRQGFHPLFISSVLLLSAILTIVVLFVLGRNIVKLYLERTQGRPGSRYRTKVISLVASLTLLPSLLLFFVASGILGKAVGQRSQPQVESIVAGGMQLVDWYEAREAGRGHRLAEEVSSEVTARSLLRPRKRDDLAALLESKRNREGLRALAIYDLHGNLVSESHSGVGEGQDGQTVPATRLGQLLSGETALLRHVVEEGGERVLVLGVPVELNGKTEGAVIVRSGLGAEASAILGQLSTHWKEYQEAGVNQESVRQGFVLVLAFFTSLLLISAIWVGSALARTMTVPIQSLADATHAVAQGRLDVRVAVEAKDELGDLVRSFNRMLEELHEGRNSVEHSTRDLLRTNIELESRHQYIETVLENIPAGVVSLDQDGRVTNLNKVAMRMFGVDDRPAPGIHYRELFAAKEFLELRTLMGKVMGIRNIKLMDKQIRFPRRALELSVSFTALRDSDDRDMGLILVLEDLSSLIRAQKLAAWRDVAQTIAHEIKNPLTPIQLGAQRILKKWREGDPDVGRVIEDSTQRITEEVDELMTMVNDFSRFARMPVVTPVPTELDKIIHNVLMLYEGVHPELVIERQVASDIPTLNLDPEQMKRVLINLVDNAIHCQDCRGRVGILGSYDARSQSVRLEVVDEGPGIAPEDRDRLFLPAFSTKKGGTGLGLAIVHRIVSDHNGKVWIEDNVPRGSRFIIELSA